MQTAGNFIGIFIELAAGVQNGHNYFQRGLFGFFVFIHRDTATVVLHSNHFAFGNGDIDRIAIAGHCLVDAVIDDFVNEVMQTAGANLDDQGKALLAEDLRSPCTEEIAVFRAFARPVVGLTTLAVVMLTYFGRVRFKGRLPGGLVAVMLGTLLAWIIGIAPVGAKPVGSAGLHLPVPVLGDIVAALTGGHALTYASVILPMGLFNVLGSLQNLESAEAAGDAYPTRSSLAANGVGSIAAALFGSPFPTTIYIGHPGWKALGARAGYSILNGAFITLVCLTGTLAWIAWAVPIDAGMAIVIWIGLVMSAQAFQSTPREHAPAVVVGLLPGLGAWGTLMAKQGFRAGGGTFGPEMVEKLRASDTWIDGAFALEQGFIFTAMILSAVTVAILERKWVTGALWSLAAAVFSALGLMHGYRFTPGDVAIALRPGWGFVVGYLIMALVIFTARWTTEEGVEH